MKSAEEIMNILEAYDLTGSLRDAAELAGCSHHTVARYVAERERGRAVPAAAQRPQPVIGGFLPKLEELVERSKGKIRADVAHEKITAMGYAGSERTTRRAVAQLKAAWRAGRRRVFRPWIPEPGMWAQYDIGDGPRIGDAATVLFCLWLAWSRFRVVLPLLDKSQPSVQLAIDVALRRIGGVPTGMPTPLEQSAGAARCKARAGRREHPDGQAEPIEKVLLAAERHAALREAFTHLSPRDQQLIALLIEDPPAVRRDQRQAWHPCRQHRAEPPPVPGQAAPSPSYRRADRRRSPNHITIVCALFGLARRPSWLTYRSAGVRVSASAACQSWGRVQRWSVSCTLVSNLARCRSASSPARRVVRFPLLVHQVQLAAARDIVTGCWPGPGMSPWCAHLWPAGIGAAGLSRGARRMP